ncbi:hypothetical protein FACS1894155_07110 [Bacteroidia bacterium]|nr:hypothetical protein FACS1894155_07110 [Bacteroidia bacterium]
MENMEVVDRNRELVKNWGENTAYAAKSHFKSADLRRHITLILVVVNILFAVFSVIQTDIHPVWIRAFGVISLLASIFILVFESSSGKDIVKKHMYYGEKYLVIHNTLRSLYSKDDISDMKIKAIEDQLNQLTEEEKPIVSQIGKRIAKRAIEKKGEVTMWWKDS